MSDNSTFELEIIMQLCRIQIQKERERTMSLTPSIRGIRGAMDMLKHNLELDAAKLHDGIAKADEMRKDTFSGAHAVLGAVRDDLKEVTDYLEDLRGSNAAPLESSSKSSETVVNGASATDTAIEKLIADGPRSSEVAQK